MDLISTQTLLNIYNCILNDELFTLSIELNGILQMLQNTNENRIDDLENFVPL